MNYHPDLPETWPGFTPLIIAHDVGYKRDRSTAVVGGGSPFRWTDLGLRDFQELPQGLCGSDRANALASIDRHYRSDALIVADLSNEPSYGEILYQTFGSRVIGLHITHHGDGMNAEWRRAGPGAIPVYNIGRTHLIEQFLSLVENDKVRFVKGPESQRAYAQLVDLQMELRPGGTVYRTLPGHHDDLAISCCMVAWAARHPHLRSWSTTAFADRLPRPKVPQHDGWAAFV